MTQGGPQLPTDFDGLTGKLIRWKTPITLPGESSPIVTSNVGDQLWIFYRQSILHRIAAGPEAKLLGTANLGEKTDAQPAYTAGRIYIRGKDNLYCIGAK